MTPAQSLALIAASLLLVASRRESVAGIEDGSGLGTFDPLGVLDTAEAIFNQMTELPVNVSAQRAAANAAAFLYCIRRAEGTASRGADGAYRVCFGYGHTLQSFADHPAVTGEWMGERLSDTMCRNAGFGPGCKSTAAGAYQIVKPTWVRLRDRLGLPDFSPASQDRAALELVRSRGALADVQAGRFEAAVRKCRNEWASLPGNYAGQGQRSMTDLAGWFADAGGAVA